MKKLLFALFVSVVEKSGDTKLSKTGNVSATWASQASCPNSCPLKTNGCYAEAGRAALSTRRLNERTDASALTGRALTLEIARQEAAEILKLSGRRKLRVHAVGDCTDNDTAGIVGSAMVAHEAKHGKAAWTYTHAAADIDQAAWNGARVLASCQSVDEVRRFRSKGYGTALIVPPHPTNKIYDYQGERVIPCPAQLNKAVTCEFCTLCQRPDFLRDNKLSVGFEPDRGTAAKVLKTIPLTLAKAA